MARIREGRRAGLRLRAYALLSRALFPGSYLGKVLLAAFVGTHIPLLVLVLYVLLVAGLPPAQALPVLAVALAATLVGSVVTLSALYVLLAPPSAASIALRAYLERDTLPELPTDIDDEGGRLLGDVQGTIVRLDGVIRSLQELSREDALTGAHNRRACEERLAEEVARAERGGEALALAAVDLDKLKEINDRCGHASGDACLRHLAITIGHNIRESDWLARWGGDEFVVAFWDAGSPSAAEGILARVAEDLRRNPARLPRGGQERVGASVGMAWYRSGESAQELFERADAALLEAKRRGRNKIVRAT